ncbi:NAD(P)H-binding protein (plasmid) [Glaciihabitans sp. INWT7]|uniref:NAD(P)-dependent oxidoreductase n=1 Tax=Glaciihabitans sp. INWT7 TaxID=2596912 RepID=UPI0016254250|nr:NAD(P)H-binding protein [Glaciihabitans sp. INWT7]QNE48625.1 NAD(P)H-binding protein [Glaciihabitans sp. INWT7]
MTVIALFGATGKTGRRVLHRLLTAGFDVRVLVRDPRKLSVSDARVTIIHGDVLDLPAVEATVAGSGAVVSVFGQVKGSPASLQTEGTRNIVTAMDRRGVKRLVTLSGGGVRAAQDKPKAADIVIQFLLKVMAGHVLADARDHLQVLQASDTDWTVVRGPRLTEQPGRGTFRVGWVGVNASTQISRDDLADFILTQIDDRSFIHEMPFVSR